MYCGCSRRPFSKLSCAPRFHHCPSRRAGVSLSRPASPMQLVHRRRAHNRRLKLLPNRVCRSLVGLSPSKRPHTITTPSSAASSWTRFCVSGFPLGDINKPRTAVFGTDTIYGVSQYIGAQHHACATAGSGSVVYSLMFAFAKLPQMRWFPTPTYHQPVHCQRVKYTERDPETSLDKE